MKDRKEKNYVDLIPAIRPDLPWKVLEDGVVEITVEHTGFYNWIAQKFFHRPRCSYIKLEGYGSFVWKQIDGQKTIYEIGKQLEAEHTEASNQLYERLCKYFGILKSNGFIVYQNK